MKARTEAEVLELLDAEFAWRRKELSEVAADINSAAGKSRPARIRGGTALLYAHWEGFVKAASEAYVEFVARRRLQYRELCPGFLSLAFRSRLGTFARSDDVSAHVAFVEFILGDLESHAQLPKLGVVKTGSNLNSQRFKAIVITLGLDYSPFELKGNLIDSQLLDWRNRIAHGRSMCPTVLEFELLYRETSEILRNFKDQISNAVVQKTYLRKR